MTRLQLASEGAYVPTPHEPTYDDDGTLPAVWTPQHIALRLIEAFRIDKRLPRVASPKAPGSAHPQMEYSDEEKAEWEEVKIDPSRFHPTFKEIETMEEAFRWLLWLTADTSRSFRAWASWRANVEIEAERCVLEKREPTIFGSPWIKLGISKATLFRHRTIALETMAAELAA